VSLDAADDRGTAIPDRPIDLRGRLALVTGAARGIGAGCARALSASGASLALCDRDPGPLDALAAELRARGAEVTTGVFDVRDQPAVAAFVSGLAPRARPIHVLVNNAGGTFAADFLDLSARAEDALVAENFTSVGHCIRAVVPRMPEEGASIVNITSIEAWRAAPRYAVYAAMKAAVESLSRSLSLELAGRGIRVNCVAVDAVETPGLDGARVETPLARMGHPADVAGAVLYLASDLSRFVTGTTLHVDGGTHAAGGWRRQADGRFSA